MGRHDANVKGSSPFSSCTIRMRGGPLQGMSKRFQRSRQNSPRAGQAAAARTLAFAKELRVSSKGYDLAGHGGRSMWWILRQRRRMR
jgi:hypothetical protein